MVRFSSFVCLVAAAAALHPRPEYSDYASFARWLVHESDYVRRPRIERGTFTLPAPAA